MALPAADQALVPPRLVENPRQMEISTSRVVKEGVRLASIPSLLPHLEDDRSASASPGIRQGIQEGLLEICHAKLDTLVQDLGLNSRDSLARPFCPVIRSFLELKQQAAQLASTRSMGLIGLPF